MLIFCVNIEKWRQQFGIRMRPSLSRRA